MNVTKIQEANADAEREFAVPFPSSLGRKGRWFTPSFSRPRKRWGFTLVELLVVVAITVMLSAFIITYSGTSRNEVALYIEAQKISQFILQAKSLSIATYGSVSNICAYGFGINSTSKGTTYSIFAYEPKQPPPKPPCPGPSGVSPLLANQMYQWSESAWNVPLADGITIANNTDSLNSVIFYPPAPTTLIGTGSGNTVVIPTQTYKIYLTTNSGKNSITISVNPAGQVSF